MLLFSGGIPGEERGSESSAFNAVPDLNNNDQTIKKQINKWLTLSAVKWLYLHNSSRDIKESHKYLNNHMLTVCLFVVYETK